MYITCEINRRYVSHINSLILTCMKPILDYFSEWIIYNFLSAISSGYYMCFFTHKQSSNFSGGRDV